MSAPTIRVPAARPEGCTCTWAPAVARDAPSVAVAASVVAADPACPVTPHAPLWVSGRALAGLPG